MATRFDILYRDGTEAGVWMTPRALLAYERKFPNGSAPRLEGTYYAAWVELEPGVPFDEWVDTIRTFDEVSNVDPRQATQLEPSLPSPPPPASPPEQQPN